MYLFRTGRTTRRNIGPEQLPLFLSNHAKSTGNGSPAKRGLIYSLLFFAGFCRALLNFAVLLLYASLCFVVLPTVLPTGQCFATLCGAVFFLLRRTLDTSNYEHAAFTTRVVP